MSETGNVDSYASYREQINISTTASDFQEIPADNMAMGNFSLQRFDPFPTEECGCANCSNKRQICNLMEQFQNRKSFMLSELGSLRAYCSQLDENASLLNSKIATVSEVLSSSRPPGIIDNVLAHLQNSNGHKASPKNTDEDYLSEQEEWSLDPVNRSRSENKSESVFLDNAVENSDQVLNEDHFLIADCQSLDKFNNVAARMLKSDSPSSLTEKTSENKVEHGLNNERVTNASTFEGRCLSPIQKLVAMKKAFDVNQHIIVVQEQQLANAYESITKYEQFANELWSFAGNVVPQEESENFKGDLTGKLTHLCECVKRALADNGLMCKKVDAMQKVLHITNREKALLSETVASLNEHIDALTKQNDKLLHQFDKGNNRKRRCKSPLAFPNVSSYSLSGVDTRASGDSTCHLNTSLCFPTNGTTVVLPIVMEEDGPRNKDVLCTHPSCHYYHHNGSKIPEGIEELMTTSKPVGEECWMYDFSRNLSSRPLESAFSLDLSRAECMEKLQLMAKCLEELKASTCNKAGPVDSLKMLKHLEAINMGGGGGSKGGFDVFDREKTDGDELHLHLHRQVHI